MLLPGTALAELAWHAGMLAGCPVLAELTMLSPLAVPAADAVQIQVQVGPPDAAAHRPVTISARPARQRAGMDPSRGRQPQPGPGRRPPARTPRLAAVGGHAGAAGGRLRAASDGGI